MTESNDNKINPLNSCLESALVALQFLTQIPVKFKCYPDDKTVAASLIFYPLVGLLIGSAIVAIASFSSNVPSLFSSAIILLFWIAITGALHLDGLADTCDAWLGGIGNKQRTLDIMKDPCSGPVAVVVLICTLLIKFSAIVSIIEAQQLILLLLAPLIARSILPVFLINTPYVRSNGIGALLVKNAPKKTVFIAGLLGLLVSLLISSLWVIVFAVITVFVIRQLAIKRLQGLTGDIAGAALELIETMVLVSLVYIIY